MLTSKATWWTQRRSGRFSRDVVTRAKLRSFTIHFGSRTALSFRRRKKCSHKLSNCLAPYGRGPFPLTESQPRRCDPSESWSERSGGCGAGRGLLRPLEQGSRSRQAARESTQLQHLVPSNKAGADRGGAPCG